VGGAGNDILIGAGGADTMVGGGGNDIYEVTDLGDQVIEAAGGGGDTVWTSLASYSLGADVENLFFGGSGNFAGNGNELANSIAGGAGNDVLIGGAGVDMMTGGGGSDIYEITDLGDQAVELADAGSDTVWTSLASYTLDANVENLFFGGSGNFVGTGNGLANTIVGGAGNDFIVGAGGNDLMSGGVAGNDTFVFGAAGFGNDTILNFGADAAAGQDLLDLTPMGISSATFAPSLTITADGADTVVGIGADSIRLVGVNSAAVDQTDFILAT
ncbi:MAG: calcium-binding protein, partial [Pseudomonas sp.]